MEHTYQVAGIDVHKSMLAVVISDAAREGEFRFQRRKFGTTASELRALREWFQQQGVREAAMESTAQYWKPVWQELASWFWRRRSPTGRRGAASGTSPTPSVCCGGTWPES